VKRLIALASLVAVATSASSAATLPKSTSSAQKPAPKKIVARPVACHVAPADEYFGKLKMSVLGIRNTIRDQGLLLDVDSTRSGPATQKVNFAEDALHDWEHKYGCDRWIPWTIFALEHYYGKIHTVDGLKNVHRIVAWLKHDYPKVGGVISFANKDEAKAVQALAEAQAATPTPSPAPIAAEPSPAAEPSGAPAGGASPSPSPSPSPTVSPGAH
jgi:hypothetical protein